MASITDLITGVASGSARPVATTLTATRTAGASSITCASLVGWETGTAVHFAIYKTDTSGKKVIGSQTDWKGIVSGSNINSLVLTAGTDSGSAIGDTVECMPTAAWADHLAQGLLVEHNANGTHGALTASSLSVTGAAVLSSGINDTNGNELIKVSSTASAVNEINVTNAATGTAPSVSATGNDTNIALNLATKGTGELQINGTGISGAWTSFTAMTAGFVTGNGSAVSYYKQIGKTVHFTTSLTWGTTTSTSGTFVFNVPITAVNRTGTRWTFAAYAIDTGVAHYTGVGVLSAGGSTFTVVSPNLTWSASSPFTWGNGDFMVVTGTYEIA